jgi:hypothetical protein
MVVWELNSPLIQKFANLAGQPLERERFTEKASPGIAGDINT